MRQATKPGERFAFRQTLPRFAASLARVYIASMPPVPTHIIGGGLAGSEAAWQLAERGHDVVIHEMRPLRPTPAHKTDRLAELVCSNTFKSTETTNAHGLLKAEMRVLGSLILDSADAARVPGGTALTVDRDVFSRAVHDRLTSHARIHITREEATSLPNVGVVATGPLTSDSLASAIAQALGVESLAFYDAIAPIVAAESINEGVTFRASRYGKETMPDGGRGTGDAERETEAGAYINCPMTREQYEAFLDALLEADQASAHDFDAIPYFEGCMPVEEMARRGRDTLRFGPMKPVGLRDPRTTRQAHAVVQLRREDRGGRMWNLVGFQTRLRYPEQQRVFRMIPGLENAEFLRYGSIHRNSYINSPAALSPYLSLRARPTTLFAGQLTGVEGYTESSATGLLAGINLSRMLNGDEPRVPPPTTMLGALYRYLRDADPRYFQPMNANFGLVDELATPVRDKRVKREQIAERALADMRKWVNDQTLVAAHA
ncbi:MAG TPA: methylenetetrahydrofolate--tRNA-(uracil(54)-C(5))-methyltransferase (FADH(2)-oxidizing) TrmFO [Gemmatimonadaceae bacterium]|nr:methylenetetrahydrofolate--tRNA-(uracil(54)-C(5))-methyltransferase (FADH(2)-oxidizing) TrmFO [Gemmatimonadaceae bacterium]